MPAATCKYCKGSIAWATLEGRTLPFERAKAGEPKGFIIERRHGTDRARPHPGGAYPNIPTYRRHNCERKK